MCKKFSEKSEIQQLMLGIIMTIILISIGSIFFKVEVKLVKSIQCKPSPVIIFFLFFYPYLLKNKNKIKQKTLGLKKNNIRQVKREGRKEGNQSILC